jgi:hypothetical protein
MRCRAGHSGSGVRHGRHGRYPQRWPVSDWNSVICSSARSSQGVSGHLLSWVLVAVGVLLPLPDLGIALRDVLRRPASCFQVGLPVVVGSLVPDAHELGNAESRSAEQESDHAAKDGDRHDNTVLPCILVPPAGRGPVFSGPNAGRLRPGCRCRAGRHAGADSGAADLGH